MGNISKIKAKLEQYKRELQKQTQYKDGLPGSALDIVNTLLKDLKEIEAENNWIPTRERLPENGSAVMTCFSSGQVSPLLYTGNGNFHGMYGDYSTETIVKWQPLPKLFEEECEKKELIETGRYCDMDKDTLQKAKELESDIGSITKILEERDKHHWIQVVSPRTDDGQSRRFQDDLAEWLRQQKEIYEKELADL